MTIGEAIDLGVRAVYSENGASAELRMWLVEHPKSRTVVRDAITAELEHHRYHEARKAARAVVEDSGPDAEGDADALVLSLEALRMDSSLLASPPALVPRVAWSGRVTLLHAPEKAGKTTFVAAALAALSVGGEWLGEVIGVAEPVLYASLPSEGHIGELVRALGRFGAAGGRTFVLHRWPPGEKPFDRLRRAIEATGAKLVIIDSVASFAELSGSPDSGDAAGWTRLLRPLITLAHETGVSIVLLHHATKDGMKYRDSTAIGASVDMILGMSEIESDRTLRRLKPRGRWEVEPYSVRLVGDRFELTAGEASLDAKIVAYVAANPGVGSNAIVSAVGAQKKKVLETIARLDDKGILDNRGQGSTYAWFVGSAPYPEPVPAVVPGSHAGPVPDPVPGQVPQQVTAGNHPPVPETGSPIKKGESGTGRSEAYLCSRCNEAEVGSRGTLCIGCRYG